MQVKRILCGLLSGLFILTNGITTAYAADAAFPVNNIIHQSVESKTITAGVTQDKIIRYTDLGWQTIYVMKADLTNTNVHIDALANKDNIQKPLSTMDHMKEWGAIAGINGSFFLASEQAGQQNVIGPMLQGQNMKTADASFNKDKDNMATFAIDGASQPVFGYWKADIRVYAPNGEYISVTRYNEPYYG